MIDLSVYRTIWTVECLDNCAMILSAHVEIHTEVRNNVRENTWNSVGIADILESFINRKIFLDRITVLEFKKTS